jgi:hypothetical protein
MMLALQISAADQLSLALLRVALGSFQEDGTHVTVRWASETSR